MNSSIPVVSIIVSTATLYILFVAIGFAGVYALVSTSNAVMSDTIDKEKLKNKLK